MFYYWRLFCLFGFIIKLIDCQNYSFSQNTSASRDELLYWANQMGNMHIQNTHLAEVAACVIAKDEHLDILEFIEYHKYIGIGKFYLYDNKSKPPMNVMLRDYIESGILDYQYLGDTYLADDFLINKEAIQTQIRNKEIRNSVQVWSMSSCILNYAKRHNWIAIIDVDEFIVFENANPSQNPPHLPTFLEQYKETGGLVLFRRFFGSSNLKNRPQGGVLASYVKCTGNITGYTKQMYPKVIQNTRYVGNWCRVHFCESYKLLVNTKNETMEKFITKKGTWDKLLVHHYATKSLEDFRQKQLRGMPHASGINKGTIFRRKEFLDKLDSISSATCNQAVQFSKVCCKNAISKQNQIYKLLQQNQSICDLDNI